MSMNFADARREAQSLGYDIEKTEVQDDTGAFMDAYVLIDEDGKEIDFLEPFATTDKAIEFLEGMVLEVVQPTGAGTGGTGGTGGTDVEDPATWPVEPPQTLPGAQWLPWEEVYPNQEGGGWIYTDKDGNPVISNGQHIAKTDTEMAKSRAPVEATDRGMSYPPGFFGDESIIGDPRGPSQQLPPGWEFIAKWNQEAREWGVEAVRKSEQKAAIPPTLQQEIARLAIAGDTEAARSLFNFANQPTQAQQLQMAMDIAKSPADFFHLMQLSAGSNPMQQEGGYQGAFRNIGPRGFDSTMPFLNELFGQGVGQGDGQEIIAPQQLTADQSASIQNSLNAMGARGLTWDDETGFSSGIPGTTGAPGGTGGPGGIGTENLYGGTTGDYALGADAARGMIEFGDAPAPPGYLGNLYGGTTGDFPAMNRRAGFGEAVPPVSGFLSSPYEEPYPGAPSSYLSPQEIPSPIVDPVPGHEGRFRQTVEPYPGVPDFAPSLGSEAASTFGDVLQQFPLIPRPTSAISPSAAAMSRGQANLGDWADAGLGFDPSAQSFEPWMSDQQGTSLEYTPAPVSMYGLTSGTVKPQPLTPQQIANIRRNKEQLAGVGLPPPQDTYYDPQSQYGSALFPDKDYSHPGPGLYGYSSPESIAGRASGELMRPYYDITPY